MTSIHRRPLAAFVLLLAIASSNGFALAAPDTPLRAKKPSRSTEAQRPVRPPRQPSSCAEFGAGFVRMPGSSTCIQFGGAVDAGFGVGPGR